MPESSAPGPRERDPGDRRWETFTARELAYQVREALDMLGDDDAVTQRRLIAIEEVMAARWPRRWILRRRLARAIRASVAGYADDYIPRGDFRTRRLEFIGEMATVEHVNRVRHAGQRQAGEDAQREEGRP